MKTTNGKGIEYVDGVPFKKPEVEEGSLPERTDLRRETAKWIRENPQVANLFLKFALEMASRKQAFGISLITERVRWETYFEWGDKYKINNNYRAYIARWIIAKELSVEAFLRFRKVRC